MYLGLLALKVVLECKMLEIEGHLQRIPQGYLVKTVGRFAGFRPSSLENVTFLMWPRFG